MFPKRLIAWLPGLITTFSGVLYLIDYAVRTWGWLSSTFGGVTALGIGPAFYIVGISVFPVYLLINYIYDRIGIRKLFKVYPIQSSGENIFYIDRRGEPRGFDEFFVKVHLNLWTKYDLEIVNIDLSYDAEGIPGPQKISFDQVANVYEEIDQSYRMTRHRQIRGGSISGIFISRTFKCNYGQADYADYGVVTLHFEFASPTWDGIKILIIKGKLEPGGKLKLIETSLRVQLMPS